MWLEIGIILRKIANELTDELAARNQGLLTGTEPDCACFEVASAPT